MADSRQDQDIDTMRLEYLVEPKCKELNTHTHTMGGVKGTQESTWNSSQWPKLKEFQQQKRTYPEHNTEHEPTLTKINGCTHKWMRETRQISQAEEFHRMYVRYSTLKKMELNSPLFKRGLWILSDFLPQNTVQKQGGRGERFYSGKNSQSPPQPPNQD